MQRQTKQGWSFLSPRGDLDWRIVHSVEAAQSNAAAAHVGGHSWELPKDWDAAYVDGFRIVSVELVANIQDEHGVTFRAYADRREPDEGRDTQHVGTTMSQVGLALRLGHTASWVSRAGATVTGYALDAPGAKSCHRETWKREHDTNGRTIGYRRSA